MQIALGAVGSRRDKNYPLLNIAYSAGQAGGGDLATTISREVLPAIDGDNRPRYAARAIIRAIIDEKSGQCARVVDVTRRRSHAPAAAMVRRTLCSATKALIITNFFGLVRGFGAWLVR